MNPIKGEAPLVLSDGRTYTVVLDFEALVEAETLYGKPLPTLMADAAIGFVGAVRALLFGALRARHPDITAVDTAQIIMTDFDAVGAALQGATDNGFPKAEGKKPGNARPAGKTSGRNGAKQGSTQNPSGARPRARSR
jgi:hypothetical protein